nr:MAG TPA: hypothetical protein [Caudoviricetes sp.]
MTKKVHKDLNKFNIRLVFMVLRKKKLNFATR